MRGFTLMELMVTLAVAALILGFGVPSFRNIMANSRMTTQANEFIGAINVARSEAITRNMPVTLCRADSAADTECAEDNDFWLAWIVVDDAGNVIRNGEIDTYNDTVLVTSDLTNQSVTFGSDGLATSGGAALVDSAFSVCTTRDVVENFRVITVGAGSRVSTEKTSGTCS
jgi:type IV fimbrial biogenesis protein FimT